MSFSTNGNSVSNKTISARFRVYPTVQTEAAPQPLGGVDNGEVEDYSWTFAPLAVTLAGFSAQQVDDTVRVSWETASELGNLGFNLYRSTSPAGPDVQLNAALIPSQAPGSSSGFPYTWDDRADLVAGADYYYWLEDVDLSGATTLHGPASVSYVGPTAVTLNGMQASPGLDTLRYSTDGAGLSWLWVVAGAGAALAVGRRRR